MDHLTRLLWMLESLEEEPSLPRLQERAGVTAPSGAEEAIPAVQERNADSRAREEEAVRTLIRRLEETETAAAFPRAQTFGDLGREQAAMYGGTGKIGSLSPGFSESGTAALPETGLSLEEISRVFERDARRFG